MIQEITPTNGLWFQVIQLLKIDDEAFKKSAASFTHKGMPTNHIACISHVLCDERMLACNILLT
jgi:hypothetical protein